MAAQNAQFFSDKTYLVTGASSGIGRAVVRSLAAVDANIILLARNIAGMQETISGLRPGKQLILPIDLSKLESIEAQIENAVAWKGSLQGIAYCAGIGGRARLRDTDIQFMQARMTINCFAFVELVRCVTRLKKKADPLRVIAISSLASLGHHRYMTAYSASKAALEASAKTMAVELARRNTRVNLIRPAYVNTPMIEDPLGNIKDLIKEEDQPLGIISPEEVANMALFLLGPASDHINGAVFELNAGAFD